MEYVSESIEKYLADAASNLPAPGGGSVSALAGALAAAMSEMAANFTVGKKKYKAVDAQVRACITRLEDSRTELMRLIQADVDAYSAVGEAYALPKETEDERSARAGAVEQALQGALAVPLAVMRECAKVADVAAELVGVANPNLLTDVGVSAILAEAACAGARVNVEVNLKFMRDESIVAEVRPEIETLTAATQARRSDVAEAVARHLTR